MAGTEVTLAAIHTYMFPEEKTECLLLEKDSDDANLSILIQELDTILFSSVANIVYRYVVDEADETAANQFSDAIRSKNCAWFVRLDSIYGLNNYSSVSVATEDYVAQCLDRHLMRIACQYEVKDVIQWMLRNSSYWKQHKSPPRAILGRIVGSVGDRQVWNRGLCRGNPSTKEWLLGTFGLMDKIGTPSCEYDINEDFVNCSTTSDGRNTALWCMAMEKKFPDKIKLDYARAINGLASIIDYDSEQISLIKQISFNFHQRPDFVPFVVAFRKEFGGYLCTDPLACFIAWLEALMINFSEPKIPGRLTNVFWNLHLRGWSREAKFWNRQFSAESEAIYMKAVRAVTLRNVIADLDRNDFKTVCLALPEAGFTENVLVLREAIKFGAKEIADYCAKVFGIKFEG